jgi:hypothetical protein
MYFKVKLFEIHLIVSLKFIFSPLKWLQNPYGSAVHFTYFAMEVPSIIAFCFHVLLSRVIFSGLRFS